MTAFLPISCSSWLQFIAQLLTLSYACRRGSHFLIILRIGTLECENTKLKLLPGVSVAYSDVRFPSHNGGDAIEKFCL